MSFKKFILHIVLFTLLFHASVHAKFFLAKPKVLIQTLLGISAGTWVLSWYKQQIFRGRISYIKKFYESTNQIIQNENTRNGGLGIDMMIRACIQDGEKAYAHQSNNMSAQIAKIFAAENQRFILDIFQYIKLSRDLEKITSSMQGLIESYIKNIKQKQSWSTRLNDLKNTCNLKDLIIKNAKFNNIDTNTCIDDCINHISQLVKADTEKNRKNLFQGEFQTKNTCMASLDKLANAKKASSTLDFAGIFSSGCKETYTRNKKNLQKEQETFHETFTPQEIVNARTEENKRIKDLYRKINAYVEPSGLYYYYDFDNYYDFDKDKKFTQPNNHSELAQELIKILENETQSLNEYASARMNQFKISWIHQEIEELNKIAMHNATTLSVPAQ